MKKLFTILSVLLICTGISAQVNSHLNNTSLKTINNKITLSGDEALSHLLVSPNITTSASVGVNTSVVGKSASLTATVIGKTTYDLQSNAAVQNRILMHDDGTISAGWTMSAEYAAAYSDRGTGYNFFDGTNWMAGPTSTPADPRLEASRGGWPSIMVTGSGKEISMTHNTQNSYLNMTHRAATGTGPWSENIISTQDVNGIYRYLIWNRSVVGGPDNKTIHSIALTEPSGGTWTGTPFNGVSGALLYYRSQDEGVTWDKQDIQLPTLDSTHFVGMSGDIYAITAKGSTVVVAYFDDWGDSFILKSTDNGDNWTRTTFLDFPVDKYVMDDGLDLDSNGVYDQLYSTDNYGSVILDNNDQAHVFYGIMMYMDDDLTDGSSSWFPGINGVAYWNESMGEDLTPPYPHAGDTNLWYSDMMNDNWICAAPDLNGDGVVGGVDSSGGYALYYASRATMTNAGMTASGDIYLSFSGYTETADDGSQVFRHIYITRSSDGGTTWEDPVDVTPHDDFGGRIECVFGSMNDVVDDKIRIIYQKDFYPGLAVRGDEDLIENNDIIYLEIDTAGLFSGVTPPVGIKEFDKHLNLNLYPNPANEITTLEIESNITGETSISIRDILGKVVYATKKEISTGLNIVKINTKKLNTGIYFVDTETNKISISKKLVITK